MGSVQLKLGGSMPQILRIAVAALPLPATPLLAVTNVSPVHAQTVETSKREILLKRIHRGMESLIHVTQPAVRD
jgi:hypothetical protein